MMFESKFYNNLVRYLSNTLSYNEKIVFEDSLSKSNDKIDYLLQIQKELFLMDNSPFEKLPDDCFKNRVASRLDKNRKNLGNNKKTWGDIAVKFYDSNIKVLKNTFSLSNVISNSLVFRNDSCYNHRTIFSNTNFIVEIQSFNSGVFKLFINLHNSNTQQFRCDLFENDFTGRLCVSLTNYNDISDFSFPYGKYLLSFIDKPLNITVI